jgi:membrane protein implicated in regulation of membrane protease activity
MPVAIMVVMWFAIAAFLVVVAFVTTMWFALVLAAPLVVPLVALLVPTVFAANCQCVRKPR